ncbi:MAG: hypothetical protein WC933_00720 [Candidatus Paceibacterota bacterium]|jgi:hypothetical protein
MKEEELLIIVPGSKYSNSKVLFLQKIILFFYSFVGVKPVYMNYAVEEEKRLIKDGRKCVYLHWSRGISGFSVFFAVEKLKREINHYKNKHKIKLLGSSLGAQIVLDAAKTCENSIEKVVLLCPVINYDKTPIKSVPVISIYSVYDELSRLGNKIMNPFRKNMDLIGKNVNNIIIPEFTHDDFSADREIRNGIYKGKTITQLVNDFL